MGSKTCRDTIRHGPVTLSEPQETQTLSNSTVLFSEKTLNFVPQNLTQYSSESLQMLIKEKNNILTTSRYFHSRLYLFYGVQPLLTPLPSVEILGASWVARQKKD
jgi:hypothetical protein